MKAHQRIIKVLGLGAALFFLLPLTGAKADILKIPGTGACEVLLRNVAKAFNARYPQNRVEVPPSIGTVGAMRLITSDQAVLVRVAREYLREDNRTVVTLKPVSPQESEALGALA